MKLLKIMALGLLAVFFTGVSVAQDTSASKTTMTVTSKNAPATLTDIINAIKNNPTIKSGNVIVYSSAQNHLPFFTPGHPRIAVSITSTSNGNVVSLEGIATISQISAAVTVAKSKNGVSSVDSSKMTIK